MSVGLYNGDRISSAINIETFIQHLNKGPDMFSTQRPIKKPSLWTRPTSWDEYATLLPVGTFTNGYFILAL